MRPARANCCTNSRERIARRTRNLREASVEADLRKLAGERGVKAGVLINASRAALTGPPVGPSAFAVFAVWGAASARSMSGCERFK